MVSLVENIDHRIRSERKHAKKQTQENQSNSVLYSIDDRINICFYVNQR